MLPLTQPHTRTHVVCRTHRDYPLLFEGLFLIIEGACFYLTLTLVMKSKNNIVRITFVAQCLFAIVAFAFWVMPVHS